MNVVSYLEILVWKDQLYLSLPRSAPPLGTGSSVKAESSSSSSTHFPARPIVHWNWFCKLYLTIKYTLGRDRNTKIQIQSWRHFAHCTFSLHIAQILVNFSSKMPRTCLVNIVNTFLENDVNHSRCTSCLQMTKITIKSWTMMELK